MTRPDPGWRPLPECAGCGRPTRRATFEQLGGYCSSCKPIEHPAARAERSQLRDWQETVARIRRQEALRAAARAERLRLRREARQRGHHDGQL